MKDPQETALRKKLKALERKYESTSERARLNGGWVLAAPRLKVIGQQIDAAQKALDEHLSRKAL